MKSAELVCVVFGFLFDPLLGEKQIVDPDPYLMSDGVWGFDQSLIYFVEKYHVRLPEEFIEHARSQNWVPPKKLKNTSELAFVTRLLSEEEIDCLEIPDNTNTICEYHSCKKVPLESNESINGAGSIHIDIKEYNAITDESASQMQYKIFQKIVNEVAPSFITDQNVGIKIIAHVSADEYREYLKDEVRKRIGNPLYCVYE